MEGLLVAALRAAGGELVLGPDAVGVEGGRGRVTGVLVHRAARTRAVPADAVVLATGGFASGGIDLDSHGHLRETVAGLPSPARRRATRACRSARSTPSR